MPWHEPRLTGASGEPTVREGQGKLTRAENFYQRDVTTAANELTSMKRYCLQARQAASWSPHQRWRAGNSCVRQRQRYSFPAIYRRQRLQAISSRRTCHRLLLRDRRSKERRATVSRQRIRDRSVNPSSDWLSSSPSHSMPAILSQWQERCATNSRTFS